LGTTGKIEEDIK